MHQPSRMYTSAFTHVYISLHTSHTRVQLVLWKCIYQYSHTVRHFVRIPIHTNCRLARQNTLRCVCVTSLRHSSSPLCDILAIQNLRLCVTPLRYKSTSFCNIFAIQSFVLVWHLCDTNLCPYVNFCDTKLCPCAAPLRYRSLSFVCHPCDTNPCPCVTSLRYKSLPLCDSFAVQIFVLSDVFAIQIFVLSDVFAIQIFVLCDVFAIQIFALVWRLSSVH